MGYRAAHATTRFHPSMTTGAHEQKIAEIVVTEGNCQAFLFPIISTFSQRDSRWLTWITDRVPAKEQLLAYGINLDTLRLIYTNHRQDSRWLAWEALVQGNSHTVIAELGKLTTQDVHAMEGAAARGNTQGIIIRQR